MFRHDLGWIYVGFCVESPVLILDANVPVDEAGMTHQDDKFILVLVPGLFACLKKLELVETAGAEPVDGSVC